MMQRRLEIMVILAGLAALAGGVVQASPTVLDGVPSYTWTNGCSPTAAGQLFGYWDNLGYDSLFDAAGNDEFLTANVHDLIASPEHIADYWGTDAAPPHHTDNCIADFMGTSRDPLSNGGTYLSNIDDGIVAYADFRGYDDWTADPAYYGGDLTWSTFTAEIDAGRPLMLTVDCTGDGTIDHSITGIGYEDRGENGLWYACFNTWHEDETVNWYQWREVSDQWAWGVYNAILVTPGLADAVPAPGALLLGIAGVAVVGVAGRLRRTSDKRR